MNHAGAGAASASVTQPQDELTLHMIGYSHIDPVWLWQWQEGMQVVKATFRSALDRMKEYPEFKFSISSAAFHEFVQLNEPEMFEEIRARIAEGRWEIVGGWWVEPDCNVPAGESFARHGLYAQRFFDEEMGTRAKVGFNPDAFGHNGMLPQILKKSGLDFYVFMRPQINERDMPRLFWWESPDGSRVLAYRIIGEYNSPSGTLDDQVALCLPELGHPHRELMCFYGVGDHGGGPTKANIESLRALDADAAMPYLRPSTVEGFFRAILERTDPATIPVWRDEMQKHAVGCYSAHSGMKRWNRQAEQALMAAEKWSAVAFRQTGQPYPGDFRQAWTDVLFNQMHDILPGTSLEPAYDDARDSTGEALAIAARAQNHAIQSLARRINIEEADGMRPIVVFNPNPWTVRTGVEVEFGGLRHDDRLFDDAGGEMTFQPVRSLASVTGWRHRLAFVADLPGLGYRTYHVVPATPREPAGASRREAARPQRPVSLLASDAEPAVLENPFLRVEIDPRTGHLRLLDRRSGRVVIPGHGARPVPIRDPSDTWGHRMAAFHDPAGTFQLSALLAMERGPVRSTIRTEHRFGDSRISQDFTLHAQLPWLSVEVAVDWHERFTMLKLRFPTELHEPSATYEIPYGHKVRPADGAEDPGQSWIDLSGRHPAGGDAGLALVNDAKYGYDVLGSEIGLTVLRSPIYAHHEPYAPDPDGPYPFQDQGRQRFRYALFAHDGDWREAAIPRRAAELDQPPVTLLETFHDGSLPASTGFVDVEPAGVVVSVVKRAEDGDDLIVRAYEAHGRRAAATIRFPNWERTIETGFAPFEIRTFRVPRDPAAAVTETDLLEEPA
jgi:alpha-mannosidase